MDAHISVLLRHARSFRKGEIEEDDVYVWWGKLRSQYCQAPLPHLDDILALDGQMSDGDDEVEEHLYLTDYRSLYVAHLGSITQDDVRKNRSEHEHIPEYYRQSSLNADCWLQLWDIRRIVLDDTLAVSAELRNLRDVRYNDQRVSLYGGMVDLPLIVTRPDTVRWFDPHLREQLTEGRHWAEFDAERAGTGEMQRELRENRFGPKLWGNFDPAARSFLATAEQLFRTHKNDAAFDLSTIVVDFAKAVEVHVNGIVRESLAVGERELRMCNVDGRTVDVVSDGPWPLATLADIIGGDKARNDWFRKHLENGEWFAASLPAVIEELRAVRNPASHGGAIERERIAQLRASLIGVGHKGNLVELAQVKLRTMDLGA